MTIDCHSTRKYSTGTLIAVEQDTPLMRVETWRHGAGRLPEVIPAATEIAVMLSGRLNVERRGDGRYQKSAAGPGTFWLCPAGIHESCISLSDTMVETVHFFLPPDLLGATALEEWEIDPGAVQLDYAGGCFDPMLNQIATAFRTLRHAPEAGINRLLSDSLRITLAAHLLRSYLVRPASRDEPTQRRGLLDDRRLRRVVDLVETRPEADFSLQALADEACLSPFHFVRAFHRTVGKTPYQYVVERRIEKAKDKLRSRSLSLVQIAAESGFATQSGFTRTFRKLTGVTPGRFRDSAAEQAGVPERNKGVGEAHRKQPPS
ncbi:helix-turn-helix transcriptional regulator [Rhizobium sp. CG5]|uniref:helix-turn-helix domain-containing protein n=1 Tax=Rhizobium sp. CG5 TaxID=2726076 RepID=UPI00203477B1|nr:AraC family transcriptional regulator [Rhizobium sp. CG5]MCM2477578.1 helix-turn-helix transcriptional regulator [Rhizobium sp. CG5]